MTTYVQEDRVVLDSRPLLPKMAIVYRGVALACETVPIPPTSTSFRNLD
jgi:hypothetical protein